MSSISLVLVYFFTNSIKISVSYGILEIIVKMIAYYIHETIWEVRR